MSSDSRRVFRLGTTNAVGALVLAAIGLLGAGLAALHQANEGHAAAAAIFLAWTAIALFLAVRTLLWAVVVEPEVIIARGILRTIKIPWSEIDHFELGRKDPQISPIGIAVLRDGTRIGLTAIQRPNPLFRPGNRFAPDSVEALNRMLAARRDGTTLLPS
jgi:hypothetical protein